MRPDVQLALRQIRRAGEVDDLGQLKRRGGRPGGRRADGGSVVAEPEITALLQGVASANGGKLDGLDFKFKGKASMQRKV